MGFGDSTEVGEDAVVVWGAATERVEVGTVGRGGKVDGAGWAIVCVDLPLGV